LNQNPFELQGYKYDSLDLVDGTSYCDNASYERGTDEFVRRVYMDHSQPIRDPPIFLKMKYVTFIDADGFSHIGRLYRQRSYKQVPISLLHDSDEICDNSQDWHTLKLRFKKADRLRKQRKRVVGKEHMRANKDILNPGPDYFLLNVPLEGDPVPIPPTMVSEVVFLLRRIDENTARIAREAENRFDSRTKVLQLFIIMAVCIVIMALMMANLDILNPGPLCFMNGSDVAALSIEKGIATCSLCKRKLAPYCPDSDVGVHYGHPKYNLSKGRMTTDDY